LEAKNGAPEDLWTSAQWSQIPITLMRRIRIRIKVKCWTRISILVKRWNWIRISIKVLRIRNPELEEKNRQQ
jgi:hypothetical protein